VSNIIDIKTLEIQKVNKQYRVLRDERLKIEEQVAKLEKSLCEKKMQILQINIKLRNLEEHVLKDLK